MARNNNNEGRGWHGDPEGHAKAGSMQGQENNPGNFANDPGKAKRAGQKGGESAQRSGHAHELTEEERSRGGSVSGGNFKNDPERASEAGHEGGIR